MIRNLMFLILICSYDMAFKVVLTNILERQIGISIVFTHVRSHIPVPSREKDKKRTAARRSHTGRTSICDVIVMLK